MNASLRLMVFGGTLLLTVSFFLPPHFYNAPLQRCLWAFSAALPIGRWGESLAFAGVALSITYPYLWSLIASLGWLPGRCTVRRWALWSQLICHLLGGGILTSLGIVLLRHHDTTLSRAVQLAACLLPAIMLTTMLAAALFLHPSRRLPAVTALGLLPWAPLQVILGVLVMRDGGPSWGYFLGAAGGITALIGCVVLFLRLEVDVFDRRGRGVVLD